MKKFIFTFPRRHPLKNHYQPVIANDSVSARERIFERYGEDWAFQYTVDEWVKWQLEAMSIGLKLETELAPMYAKEDD